MNAVEIEEAVSALAEQAFDAAEFPFAFLLAFGNKETTIKRLRAGASNKSDLGGVLQTNNIHITVRPPGEVTKTLTALKASPATARAKARFILATDGADFEAECGATGGRTVKLWRPNRRRHESDFRHSSKRAGFFALSLTRKLCDATPTVREIDNFNKGLCQLSPMLCTAMALRAGAVHGKAPPSRLAQAATCAMHALRAAPFNRSRKGYNTNRVSITNVFLGRGL